MSKVSKITGQEAIRAFCKAGFCVARTSGSHYILKSDNCPFRLSIAVHAGKTLGTGLLENQIKKPGLTVEKFIELL